MVEVFKTNVTKLEQAELLLLQIHENFKDYRANFDLEDCDSILRIECCLAEVCAETIITLLKNAGYCAEVLPDGIPGN